MRQQPHRRATDIRSGRLALPLVPSARQVVTVLLLPAVVVATVSIVRANTAANIHSANATRRSIAERAVTRSGVRPQPGAEAPAALDQPGTPAIGARDGSLTLSGYPYRFVGVDAYELATEWGTNSGCGDMETDAQLDGLFSSLAPNSLVRIWAFQGSMATNVRTGALDWSPLDRVFAAAAAYRQRLIVVLTDQGGTCDGNAWQGPSWYRGGFMRAPSDSSTVDRSQMKPLSYWDYLQAVVNRYKNAPALGMWEPVSEPEASTCVGYDGSQPCWGHNVCVNEAVAAQALRHFFDVVGGEIHALDPRHLVESGTIGGGQCGTAGSDYEYVSASPGIDVLSYHDYYPGAPLGGDQWNGLAVRLAQAAALGKPIIGGEVGEKAGFGPGCPSVEQRAADFGAKLRAQLQAGSSGLLVWDWLPASRTQCTTDVTPGDPLVKIVDAGVTS